MDANDDVDPVVNVDTGRLAAESAALTASNESLSDRIDNLMQTLATKTEVRRTKAAAIWSIVVNVAHVAITVIAILFGVGYVDAQNQVKTLAECTNRQFEIQQDNTNLLRDAATKERIALRTLVDSIANPTATQADKQKAFLIYQSGLHAADTQRGDVKPVERCSH